MTGLRLSAVPAEVVAFTKNILLDCAGCMVAGRTTEMGRIALTFAQTVSHQEEARLSGGRRVAIERAAFANTLLCNALDFEPVGPEGHMGAVAVPTTLALADWRDLGGEEFLVALIAAIEVSGRIGASLRRLSVQASGGLPGVRGTPHAIFASVVPAARILGLDVEQFRNALGVAAYSANLPTLRKAMDSSDTPMTKYDHLGVMAAEGVDAARIAQLGFTGDREAFEGEFGFWRFSGALGCDWALAGEDYGKKWVIPETFFKLYPAILYVSPGILAVRAIMAEMNVTPEQIVKIEIESSRLNRGQMRAGAKSKMAPWMSYALNVANAVYDVKPRWKWHEGESFPPELVALSERVVTRPLEGSSPQQARQGYWEGHAPARAIVTTKDAVYRHEIEGLPRLTGEQLREKFLDNTEGLIGAQKARAVIAMIEDVEHLPSIRQLAEALA